MVVGGPTTVLDLGGLRIISDPTFDAPRLVMTTCIISPKAGAIHLGMLPQHRLAVPANSGLAT